MSPYNLNNHISDHQLVLLFCNIDVPMHKQSDKAKATFRSTFKNKHVLNILDTESTDPNPGLNHDLNQAIKVLF